MVALQPLLLVAVSPLTMVAVPSTMIVAPPPTTTVTVTHLEPLAQLNVRTDTLAKAHLQHLLCQGHVTSTLPLAGETWSCWLGLTKVIHDPQCSLPYHLGIQSAKAYLIQKQLFSPASFELVDWEA